MGYTGLLFSSNIPIMYSFQLQIFALEIASEMLSLQAS
jgi:hypothetical protein